MFSSEWQIFRDIVVYELCCLLTVTTQNKGEKKALPQCVNAHRCVHQQTWTLGVCASLWAVSPHLHTKLLNIPPSAFRTLAGLCQTSLPLNTRSRNCFAVTLGFSGGEQLVLHCMGCRAGSSRHRGNRLLGGSSVTSLPILLTSQHAQRAIPAAA